MDKSQPPPEYKQAIVKFNSGLGALLCNGCKVILATGFYHEDKKHFCPDCKKPIKDPLC